MNQIHIKAVEMIPGEDGWWKESSRETYLNLFRYLEEKGFDIYEIMYVLENAYRAAAAEYGD